LERIIDFLDAKAKLKRLTSKPYAELSTKAKYALRYQVIVLAEALGGTCLHIAQEDLKKKSPSFSECLKVLDEAGI
jgi:uncharacterized protein YutE (UPF0331/DUF86 family)